MINSKILSILKPGFPKIIGNYKTIKCSLVLQSPGEAIKDGLKIGETFYTYPNHLFSEFDGTSGEEITICF